MSGTPKCAATLAASLGTELPESICARSPDRRQRTGTTARMRPRRCTNSPPPPPRDRRRTRTAHLEFRRVECLLHRAALAGGQRASEAAYSPEGVVANPRGLLPRPRRHASERALHSTIRGLWSLFVGSHGDPRRRQAPRTVSCSLASGTWLPYKGWHRRRPRRGLRASAGCRPRRCRWCGSTLATTQR